MEYNFLFLFIIVISPPPHNFTFLIHLIFYQVSVTHKKVITLLSSPAAKTQDKDNTTHTKITFSFKISSFHHCAHNREPLKKFFFFLAFFILIFFVFNQNIKSLPETIMRTYVTKKSYLSYHVTKKNKTFWEKVGIHEKFSAIKGNIWLLLLCTHLSQVL